MSALDNAAAPSSVSTRAIIPIPGVFVVIGLVLYEEEGWVSMDSRSIHTQSIRCVKYIAVVECDIGIYLLFQVIVVQKPCHVCGW